MWLNQLHLLKSMHQSSNHSIDPVTHHHWLEFENRRLKASGNEFQRLFEDIMVRAKPGFMRIRPYGNIGDRKCDGLFQADSTFYQVYSPDELKQADLQQKIDEDLDGAIQYWGDELKKWLFVYNVKRGLPPDIPSMLEKKKQQYPNIAIEPLSNDGLWEVARGLTTQQRIEIFGAPASSSEYVERQTWLNTAMQRSRARCIARWQSIGVSRSDAVTFADDVSIGIPPSDLDLSPSKLIILAGEMGIGKSLIGDRLFQSAIQAAIENPIAPIPAFFEAWQLQNKLLEEAIKEITHGLCNPQHDSTFVIIDGVDEIGVTNAIRFLNEARILVQMWQQVTILFVSKPTLEFNDAEELVKVPLLSKDVSEDLVRRLSNLRCFSANSLPKLLQDAILRPLFAILLSTYLREHGVGTLQSKEQLLSNLVERSLRPLRENIARVSHLLEQLAVTCIDRGRRAVPSHEIASWSERQQLLDSRLVVNNGEELQFPLPILTQWFGAQYLLKSNFITETFWSNSHRIELWRYPLAIAVATFPLQRVSELLAPIAEREPLIAAEIVSEALAFQGRSLEMPFLSARELAQQVRIAMQAWINGFKILTSSVAPHLEEELPTIGVRISKRKLETDPPTSDQIITAWVEIAWHSGDENLPDVVELPPDINSDNLSSLGWKSICGFPPYILASWVWKWTLEQAISLLLKQRSIPIAASLLSLEAAWHGASSLIERDRRDSSPIPLNEIEARLSGVEKIQCVPMMHHCLKQLGIEMKAAHAKEQTHLCLPASFQSFRSNHTHSTEALLAYARDVYLGAFEGYLQLIDRLSPLIPKLQLVSILPARLVGVLALPNNSDSVSISRYWEPLPANSQNEVQFSLSTHSLPGDDPSVMAAMQKWISLRPQWWMYFTMQTSTIPQLTKSWLGANPVTELAYEFLWEDLKRMGWVDGSLVRSGFPYTY